jgi:hypothetical protein
VAKKGKTRQEKIISRLRRQVAISSTVNALPPKLAPLVQEKEKAINNVLSCNPKLLKKDLLKTALLSFVIVTVELVLYSKLK